MGKGRNPNSSKYEKAYVVLNRGTLKQECLGLGAFWQRFGPPILEYGCVPERDGAIGVGASTYRAYGKFIEKKKIDGKVKAKPIVKASVIFKVWAKKYFKKHSLESAPDFEKFHNRALHSLAKYWKNKAGRANEELSLYPYASKLVDLHIKHMLWHWSGKQNQREVLMTQVFQPLDKYSLLALKEFGVGLSPDREIPKTPSMGKINATEYHYLQEEIQNICKAEKVPVFAFDHFAWGRTHVSDDEDE